MADVSLSQLSLIFIVICIPTVLKTNQICFISCRSSFYPCFYEQTNNRSFSIRDDKRRNTAPGV